MFEVTPDERNLNTPDPANEVQIKICWYPTITHPPINLELVLGSP